MHDRAQKVLRFAVTGALVGAATTTTGCDALSRILGREPEPPTINVPPEPPPVVEHTINVPPDPQPPPEGTAPPVEPTPPEPEPNG